MKWDETYCAEQMNDGYTLKCMFIVVVVFSIPLESQSFYSQLKIYVLLKHAFFNQLVTVNSNYCQVVKMYPREEGDAGDEINKKKPQKLIYKRRKVYLDFHYHCNIV